MLVTVLPWLAIIVIKTRLNTFHSLEHVLLVVGLREQTIWGGGGKEYIDDMQLVGSMKGKKTHRCKYKFHP